MIRPFTVVCMLMAVGSGLYLYQCKHQAQVLDREIARTIKQTEAARDRIGMLRAEWAQLNEPERIAELARAHSALQTAKPTQFIAANDLASRLPAPVAPTHQLQPTDVPEDTDAVPPTAQAEPPPQPAAPRVTTATPPETKPIAHAAEPKPVPTAPPTQPSAQTATPAPEPKPAHHVATASSAQTTAAIAAAQLASVHPLTRPIAPPRPVAVETSPVSSDAVAPGTVGAAVLRAMRARSAEPAVQPAVAPAPSASQSRYYPPPPIAAQPVPPAYAPQAYAAPISGSMLGGARSALPPPVPFAQR